MPSWARQALDTTGLLSSSSYRPHGTRLCTLAPPLARIATTEQQAAARARAARRTAFLFLPHYPPPHAKTAAPERARQQTQTPRSMLAAPARYDLPLLD